MTLRSSLTVWDIKLIVRCPSQIFVHGFFGNVMKIDLAISDGISPVSYIFLKSLCKVSIPMSSNVLIISVLISSGPIALFNFVFLKANSISLFIISGPDSGATNSNDFVVLFGSPYNSSLYSFHLSKISSSSKSISPDFDFKYPDMEADLNFLVIVFIF